ncbi:Protein UXT-like protein [Hordeum vulgare]|nr:Protein UXT-like protein [Hordeum vulgare]
MNAFMEIQKKMLELDAEKQAKRLEMEAENQVKMPDIEATNAKTKAKEVALSSMMMVVEIMKVDLSTVSLRKRPWFEKMQADMLKLDDEWYTMVMSATLFLYADMTMTKMPWSNSHPFL